MNGLVDSRPGFAHLPVSREHLLCVLWECTIKRQDLWPQITQLTSNTCFQVYTKTSLGRVCAILQREGHVVACMQLMSGHSAALKKCCLAISRIKAAMQSDHTGGYTDHLLLGRKRPYGKLTAAHDASRLALKNAFISLLHSSAMTPLRT